MVTIDVGLNPAITEYALEWCWRAGRGAVALGCGVLAALAAFALQGTLPAPMAQRLAFACWLVWLAAALPLSRPR